MTRTNDFGQFSAIFGLNVLFCLVRWYFLEFEIMRKNNKFLTYFQDFFCPIITLQCLCCMWQAKHTTAKKLCESGWWTIYINLFPEIWSQQNSKIIIWRGPPANNNTRAASARYTTLAFIYTCNLLPCWWLLLPLYLKVICDVAS